MNWQVDEGIVKLVPFRKKEKTTFPPRFLQLMVHADKCKRNGYGDKCNVPFCSFMKGALKLNAVSKELALRDGKKWKGPNFQKSIDHWNQCKQADCPQCLPSKEV